MAVPRTDRWQTGAVAARTLLALFVIFGLVVFFLPTAPLGDRPAAAQSATPSPNPTSARIQFLNPSSHSKVLSDKPEQGITAGTYHLNAWVANPPANPLVEFQIQQGTNQPMTIGTATPVPPDTYELYWQISDTLVPDGSYTLRAILFENGGAREVARDEEAVVVNQSGGVSETAPGGEAAETVEILYPTNAGSLGFYKGATIIDVTTPASGPAPSGSKQTPGPDEIRVFYTLTPPGSEPTWKTCGTESMANASDGVRCTLASGDQPAQVTGVAAVARDTQTTQVGPAPSPADTVDTVDESGDAHRVIAPYAQVASTVTVTPATQRVDPPTNSTTFPCSQLLSALVRDQFGRKIATHNVDVHASGPSDQLQFDTGTGNAANQPDPNKNPDANHTGSESAYNCTTAAQAGTQSEHEVAAAPDIKHIESAAQGTRDDGTFDFRLRTDTAGTTQITAWADGDDNDLRCPEEPAGSATIGWGADASAPVTPGPDQSPCPSPSPSGSPSGSASASASASPSASASASRSPSASTSPSTSPTPSGSRTITLVASDSKVVTGAQVSLSGRIFSSDSSCTDNEFVQILRRVHGGDQFAPFASEQSGSDGSYTVTFVATQSADYVATVSAHDNCRDATSDPVSVLVKVRVTLAVNDARPARGSNVAFSGKVTPNHKGTKVVLQRKKGGRWVKVAVDELSRRSTYRIVIPASWRQDRLFRVRWPSSDADHETNNSRRVKVVTHR